MTDPTTDYAKYIWQVFQKAKKKEKNLTTISPTLYNYYKDSSMPVAQTIIRKSQKTWKQILQSLKLVPNLDKQTLASLSNSLHLLAKEIVKQLKVGWEEKAIVAPAGYRYRHMRPDSLCMEEIYLHQNRIIALDIKLSVTSAALAIYKYLPLFEKGLRQQSSLVNQQTFFPEWLPKNAVNIELVQQIYDDGQMGLFFENNILFICYLVGPPPQDLMPEENISSFRHASNGRKIARKKLPMDMEVRFIPFQQLPELYCQIAGVKYTRELKERISLILEVAEQIRSIVVKSPKNARQLARNIHFTIKNSPTITTSTCQEIDHLAATEKQE